MTGAEALAIRKSLTGGKAEKGLSQSEMADLIESDPTTVANYERNRRELRGPAALLYRLLKKHGSGLLRSV